MCGLRSAVWPPRLDRRKALTHTVQVHSVWTRFRGGHPHREPRRGAFANGRTLFGFGDTGLGVVWTQDIHIDRDDSACRCMANRSPQHFEWLRAVISTPFSQDRCTEFRFRLRSGCSHTLERFPSMLAGKLHSVSDCFAWRLSTLEGHALWRHERHVIEYIPEISPASGETTYLIDVPSRLALASPRGRRPSARRSVSILRALHQTPRHPVHL